MAPYIEDLRYGTKQAGYHGGASAAEVVIPVIALTRQPEQFPAAGWAPAAPQAPQWWNDPMVAGAAPTTPAKPRRPARPVPPQVPGQLGLGVVVDETPAAISVAGLSVVDELLASAIYQAQRKRAGARALDDDVVRAVVGILIASGGRLHQSTVASAAGIPAMRIGGTLTALRRQLNVEGYDVLAIDPDQSTVLLDVTLLREQFLEGVEA